MAVCYNLGSPLWSPHHRHNEFLAWLLAWLLLVGGEHSPECLSGTQELVEGTGGRNTVIFPEPEKYKVYGEIKTTKILYVFQPIDV